MKNENSEIIDRILNERREEFIIAMSSAFDYVVNKYPTPKKPEETGDHIAKAHNLELINSIVSLDYLK